MRRKFKVPLYGNLNRSAFILEGAQLGVDLFLPDGSLATVATLAALLNTRTTTSTSTTGSSGVGPVSATLWSLIQEIPANIVSAAALTGQGLVTRRSTGDWVARTLAVASTDRLTVSNADGDGGSPTFDMADLVGLSLWGRSATTTGKPDEITGTADQVARVNSAGTSLAFGAVNLAAAAAVTGRLAFANIAQITGQAVLGVASAGAGNLAAISAGSNDTLLRQTGGTLNFGQLTAGMFPATVVPDAALSANVPLINASTNIFTGVLLELLSSGTAVIAVATSAAGSSPQVTIARSAGTVGTWQIYLPTGSTDLRFLAAAADRVTFTNAGDVRIGATLRTGAYTVATLPAGAQGDRAFVTDALAPVFGAAVVGGGAVGVPVYYDAGWNVG